MNISPVQVGGATNWPIIATGDKNSDPPIHITLKLLDGSVGVSQTFDVNITYKTLTKIVDAINQDKCYQMDKKVDNIIKLEFEDGKVHFVREQPKIPFGRKII